MPGLAGIIVPPSVHDPNATARRMVDSMLHEPFYRSGTTGDESLGLAAGWVAHEGSYADCQPIWNETRDIGLVFAGEHFADAAESQRLRAAGHVFSDGDASVLVHLYEENPDQFLLRLNGTFSGVLFDRPRKKVIVFNDRLGLARVYWHQNADGFYFASEAKALLRAVPQLRELDLRGLGELLVCGCTLQGRTLFPGIALLPPASAWVFSPGQPVRRETYFDGKAWEAQTTLPPEEYYAALRSTFDRILPRYFSGKQGVGLSITGGLDSRMIIAGLKPAPGKLACYTFGGVYRDSEDVRIGRLVAERCGQTHQVITVDESFFPGFLERAQRCVYITDGTMDVSGSVGLFVNRRARDFAPVRMTGNYGSEILRENVAFKAHRISTEPFAASFLPQLTAAVDTYRAERRDCRTLSFIAFKQVPWHHHARLAEEQSQLTIRAPYLDNELVPLAYRAPAGLLLNKQLAYRYTTDTQPALIGAPTDRGLLKLPPFLPKKIFELSKEIRPKAEYYFDYGMPNWLAQVDRVLAPLHLERLFLGQQKYYHFRMWYRYNLADAVKQVLLDPRTLGRSYLDRRAVESMVLAHTRGTGNYTTEIHKLMTCEMIHQQLIEMSS